MNDRELLEAAAKAVGIKPTASDDGPYFLRPGCEFWEWEPLEDDGDALRLAVRLGIRVEPSPRGCSAMWQCPQGLRVDTLLNSVTGTDSCATTRRAIVRAAAEIGRAMP